MSKKRRTRYICAHCAHESLQWMGNCPSCAQWNTFEEVVLEEPSSSSKPRRGRLEPLSGATNRPVGLHEIPVEEAGRLSTGMHELDRVLGGGLVPGSFVLLAGDPGIGKSTLALQCAALLHEQKVLYVSGEESLGQVRQRAMRLSLNGVGIRLLTETSVERVIDAAREERPGVLIVDSIQTLAHNDLQSMPGSVAQIRECAALLMQYAKQDRVTVIAIGHVTKEGELAGPRVLEHMVDTVLQFEGDKQTWHRILRTLKNRFGPSGEVGVFEMGETGLRQVSNPSELFLSEFDASVSGNAVVCSMEGSRPLLIEVQVLVTPAAYSVPQRVSPGFDQRRLALLLAVLEKRCNWQFSNHDVFLNVAGGMKLSEPACDLGVACALVSSLTGRAFGQPMAIIGEVGLGGEVRRVARLQARLDEAEKMGFEGALIPEGVSGWKGRMNLLAAGSLDDALHACGLV